MAKIKLLAGAALACLASLAIPAGGFAQQRPVASEAPESEARSQATDRVLLAALLERRADIARLESGTKAQAAALDFIDSRIVQLRNRIAK